MATITRQTVREWMIDTYGLGRRGTNTGTSQTAVTDDGNFGGRGAAERIIPGCWIMITSGGAAPEDEITRLSSRPVLTTGAFNLDPGLTAALAATDTYEILYPDLCFDAGDGRSIHQAIIEAATVFPWEKRLVPITDVPDGDFLASGTDLWSVTGATRTKAGGTMETHGQRVLSVTATGTTQYAYPSVNLGVEEGGNYFLEACAQRDDAATATLDGQLVLYDVTNAAAITLDDDDLTTFEPQILWNPSVTVPSTCQQVVTRLSASTSGSVIFHWHYVILRKNEAREFTVMDRQIPSATDARRSQHILQIGKVLATNESVWSRRGQRWAEVSAEAQQLDAGMWQIRCKDSVSGYSVWYEEYVQPIAMNADTDATGLPKEHLGAIATELLLRPLQSDKFWGPKYLRAAKDAAAVKTMYASLKTYPSTQFSVPYLRV